MPPDSKNQRIEVLHGMASEIGSVARAEVVLDFVIDRGFSFESLFDLASETDISLDMLGRALVRQAVRGIQQTFADKLSSRKVHHFQSLPSASVFNSW